MTTSRALAILVTAIILVSATILVGAVPAVPVDQTFTDQNVTYKGELKSAAWVDSTYAKFKDKIAKIDGAWKDCGRGIAERMTAGSDVPEPGTEIRAALPKSEATQILGADRILMARPNSETVIHIQGIDTAKLVDHSPLKEFWLGGKQGLSLQQLRDFVLNNTPLPPPERWLVYIGTYKSKDAFGAFIRTLPSYTPYAGITRQEFVEAINGGLTLTDYAPLQKTKAGEWAWQRSGERLERIREEFAGDKEGRQWIYELEHPDTSSLSPHGAPLEVRSAH
jgi:hypothetical protein